MIAENITRPIIEAFNKTHALPSEVLAEREALIKSFAPAKELADRIAACVARQTHADIQFLFYSRTHGAKDADSRYDAATALAAALNNTILAIVWVVYPMLPVAQVPHTTGHDNGDVLHAVLVHELAQVLDTLIGVFGRVLVFSAGDAVVPTSQPWVFIYDRPDQVGISAMPFLERAF